MFAFSIKCTVAYEINLKRFILESAIRVCILRRGGLQLHCLYKAPLRALLMHATAHRQQRYITQRSWHAYGESFAIARARVYKYAHMWIIPYILNLQLLCQEYGEAAARRWRQRTRSLWATCACAILSLCSQFRLFFSHLLLPLTKRSTLLNL